MRPLSFGDLEGASTDLTDGACDERGDAEAAEATEAPEFAAAMMGCGELRVQVRWAMETESRSGFLVSRRAGSPGTTICKGQVEAWAGEARRAV